MFNNVLNEANEGGWTALQTTGSGSQTLLQNAEHYGMYLAATVNTTDEPLILVRENIGKFNAYVSSMYTFVALPVRLLGFNKHAPGPILVSVTSMIKLSQVYTKRRFDRVKRSPLIAKIPRLKVHI